MSPIRPEPCLILITDSGEENYEDVDEKKLQNIAFAKGGTHLPIAHALRLLSTQELRFGLTKLKLRKKEEEKFGRGIS